MKCPRCGTPNAAYVDREGKSRSQRRKSFSGGMDKSASWARSTENDKIKCKKCGIID